MVNRYTVTKFSTKVQIPKSKSFVYLSALWDICKILKDRML